MDKADVQFLIDDQCARLQDAVNYAISSLRAIIEKGSLQKYGAGPQYVGNDGRERKMNWILRS